MKPKSICTLKRNEKNCVCGGKQEQYLCNLYRETDIDSETKAILGNPIASKSFSDKTGDQCANYSQEQSNQLYKSKKLKADEKLIWHCPECS